MKKKSFKAVSAVFSIIFTMSSAGSFVYSAENDVPENGSIIDETPAAIKAGQETQILKNNPAKFPASFDLRNVNGKNYVTPVKDQGKWNTCWSLGAIAAAETSVLYELSEKTGLSPDNFDVEFSSLQNAWFTFSQVKGGSQDGEGVYFIAQNEDEEKENALNRGLIMGGADSYVINTFSSGIGPVAEKLAPYKNKSGNHIFYKLDKETGKKIRDEGGQPVFESHPADWKWSEDELFVDGGSYGTVGEDWSVSDELKYNTSYLENAEILPSPAFEFDEEGNCVYSYNEDVTNRMKSALLSGKAVSVTYCSEKPDFAELENEDDTAFINKNYAHYTYDEIYTPFYNTETFTESMVTPNHVVCIVGYDDNYSKDNFKKGTSAYTGNDMTPPADGAWIVKNSWGSSDGEFPNNSDWGADGSGYFYLSYYDKTIYSPTIFDFDVENMYPEYFGKEKQEKIVQQYDMLNTACYEIMPSDTESSYANVFTAEQDQYLTAVSTVISTENPTTAKYQIYRLNENAKNPSDGELISEFESAYSAIGYYTEKLPEKQLIKKGQKYSVVITNKDDSCYYVSFAIDSGKGNADYYNDLYGMNVCTVYGKAVMNEGESFIYQDGEWSDFTTLRDMFNVMYPWDDEEKAYCLEKYGSDESVVVPELSTLDNFKIKAIAEPANLSGEETTATQPETTTAAETTTTQPAVTTSETTKSGETETTTVTTAASETTTQAAKYSNDELCDMASKLYREEKGKDPENVSAEKNADGSVSIIIDGEKTYTVDANTGKGTDSNGKAVDLPATGMTSPFSAVAGTCAAVMTLLGGIFISKSKKKGE